MPHQGHQAGHHGNGHGHDSHDGHHGLHSHDYADDCDEEANETSALLCADVDFSKVSAPRRQVKEQEVRQDRRLAVAGKGVGDVLLAGASCGLLQGLPLRERPRSLRQDNTGSS